AGDGPYQGRLRRAGTVETRGGRITGIGAFSGNFSRQGCRINHFLTDNGDDAFRRIRFPPPKQVRTGAVPEAAPTLFRPFANRSHPAMPDRLPQGTLAAARR